MKWMLPIIAMLFCSYGSSAKDSPFTINRIYGEGGFHYSGSNSKIPYGSNSCALVKLSIPLTGYTGSFVVGNDRYIARIRAMVHEKTEFYRINEYSLMIGKVFMKKKFALDFNLGVGVFSTKIFECNVIDQTRSIQPGFAFEANALIMPAKGFSLVPTVLAGFNSKSSYFGVGLKFGFGKIREV